ncbi:MAG: Pyoverdin chromophore biosynthetic protein pvcC [Streptosporangiales bacterium]|nr:Pyoverdin chromophore biosynthetic protein pvcC [Streptosporangiales bacterium]
MSEIATTDELLTGDAYLESLRDSRRVYLHGELVDDVTTHPAFRNSARSVAMLYDALHDSKTRDVLTAVDDQGIRTHRFFMPSHDTAELLAAREAIATWSRLNYGFMGRTPDYKAAFMAGLSARPDFYAPFDDNARSWYRRYASRGLFLNHVLINPPIDRNRPVHEVEDVYLHVVRERDGGIVVSGAKMLATGSALTHATFVAQNSAANLEPGKAEDFALVFIAMMDNPGVTLMSRQSYEQRAISPFDHPLSSRFDENDAVMIFDEAFIPWEDVLVYRDVKKATAFYPQSGFVNRYTLQSGVRMAIKLDLMIGLFEMAVRANGTDQFRGVQAAIGEAINWRTAIWGLTTAMCHDTEPFGENHVIPKLPYAATLRMTMTHVWNQLHESLETHLGGSPLVVPSSVHDLRDPDLRPLIDRFYRGSSGSAEERIKVFKLLWDAFGSEFGARHELYERNYSGNQDQIRLDGRNWALRRGELDERMDFARECMADYDTDGWVRGPWQ